MVGTAEVADGSSVAFLYQDLGMIDLNSRLPSSSGWLLVEAFAINDNGQIVGAGQVGGATHGYLLEACTTEGAVDASTDDGPHDGNPGAAADAASATTEPAPDTGSGCSMPGDGRLPPLFAACVLAVLTWQRRDRVKNFWLRCRHRR